MKSTKVFWKGVIKRVLKDEIKGDDMGCVIKARTTVPIRGAKTLYFIPSK